MLREKALSPIGKAVEIQTDLGLDSVYSVTFLTTLDPTASHPIVFDMREESNSACDFLNVVKHWIQKGHLTQGDYLIVDNASVHVSDEISEELDNILEAAGVNMRLLPTYSPELNPCELVFSVMKSHLRYWRGSHRFWLEIIHAASKVDYAKVLSFYSHCILKNNEQ